MILSEKILEELINLKEDINVLIKNKNIISNMHIENFLKNFEKRRYNILSQINIYNTTVEYKTEKIKNIRDEYKATFKDNYLSIYVPEAMPSYKNLKTHAYKNILLSIAEITKPYSNLFKGQVCILIKIFDNIKGWDVDNKYIKLISDALILNNVIEDDNIEKMFYCVKGEFSNNPHTEILIFEIENSEKYI